MFNYVLGILSEPKDKSDLIEAVFDPPNSLFVFDGSIYDPQLPLFKFGKWLEETGVGKLDGTCFMISNDGHHQYFAKKFTEFKAALEALNNVDASKFQDKKMMDERMDALRKAYENPYDIYIKLDSDKAEPLDAFLRRAEPNKPYYILSAVKYQH